MLGSEKPAVPRVAKTQQPGVGTAEWERRRKAGYFDAYDPRDPSSSSSSDGVENVPPEPSWSVKAPPPPTPLTTPPIKGVVSQTPRAVDAETPEPSPGQTPSATPAVGVGSSKPAPPQNLLNWVEKKNTEYDKLANVRTKSSGVYGFAAGGNKEASKKAIALRLEPLGSGVKAFERVLSESNQSVTIGSNRKGVDVLVNDEAVSKKHCTLELIGIKGELALSVIDNSTNGTYVNGERLAVKGKRYRVRNGDKLILKNPGLDEDFGWTCDFGNTVCYFSRGT